MRIRELCVEAYGGLGVRGLGLKQKKERTYTEARIVSFLSVSPFTFEQLQRESKIHRNTLKLRLDQLSSKGVIIKHRYSIPHWPEYYGYMYGHPLKYRSPLFHHIYYLLNLSLTEEIKNLISCYLIKNEGEWEADYKSGRIEIQTQPFFSIALSVLKHSLLFSAKQISNWQYLSPSEKQDEYRRGNERIISSSKHLREYGLSAVKNKISIQWYPLREEYYDKLNKVLEFFFNRGFLLQDILVRCSTEYTFIRGDKYQGLTGPLSLPMTNYSVLWEAVEKLGWFKIFKQLETTHNLIFGNSNRNPTFSF